MTDLPQKVYARGAYRNLYGDDIQALALSLEITGN